MAYMHACICINILDINIHHQSGKTRTRYEKNNQRNL